MPMRRQLIKAVGSMLVYGSVLVISIIFAVVGFLFPKSLSKAAGALRAHSSDYYPKER